MSSYVTIATDGSRDVDVQSLFYDQIEMVRRIARMDDERVKRAAMFLDHADRPDHAQSVRGMVGDLHAAQQRIAELEDEIGKIDDMRKAGEIAAQLRDSDLRRLVDELRDAEARNAQNLAEIARLREALKNVRFVAGPDTESGHEQAMRSMILSIVDGELESGDEWRKYREDRQMEPRECPICGRPVDLRELPPHQHSAFLRAALPDIQDHSGSWVVECHACGIGMIDADRCALLTRWNTRSNLLERVWEGCFVSGASIRSNGGVLSIQSNTPDGAKTLRQLAEALGKEKS